MGVVYKAIDTTLDSQVGLKVIRPDLAQIPSFAERFRREVRLTRQITHTNVCRVHDIGDSNGVLYLSMEWIEGETLDQLLRQAGTLRDARALEIARRIAAALDAAHGAGVVHRDLKPGNVMIDRRGKVAVLDFGLALEHGSPELTGPGLVLGTPRYMAPEQRAGRTIDARADLYALGLILVEMLVGRRPEGSAATDLPPELNPVLLPLLRRLLAEDPAKRHPTAAAVLAELEDLEGNPAISTLSTVAIQESDERRRRTRRRGGLAAGAVLLVATVAIVLVTWPYHELPPEARASYERGIHYLEEESETVAGIQNAIQMFHRAHESAPDSALVQARLAEAYWMRFDRERSIAMREEAERWSKGAAALDPELPELHTARARGFLAEDKYDAAKAELERALAKQSDSVAAWRLLGLVELKRGDYSAGLAALTRAERLAPASFLVYLGLGRLHDTFQEYDEAARSYRRALELKPDSTIAWNNLSTSYLHLQRTSDAADALRRSVEIEEYADARSNLGTLYYMLGQLDDAIEQYRRAAELEPQRAVHHSNLGDAFLAATRPDEASQAYAAAAHASRERVVREPLSLEARSEAALFCAQAGDSACARANVLEVAASGSAGAVHLLMCAAALASLGGDAEALDWLERSVHLGMSRTQIEARPEFGRLRGYPRYTRLLDLAR